MSSMRIVLVDPLGDVLFSGDSVIARGREPEGLPETLPTPIAAAVAAIAAAPDSSEAPTEPEGEDSDEYEACPDTMRSAGSGVYRAVDRTSRPSQLRDVG